MKTYRKISAAPSSIESEPFDNYSEARARADALGIQTRPLRRMTDKGVQWLVIRPGDIKAPTFQRVPNWSPSVPRADIMGEVLARIRFDYPEREDSQQPRPVIMARRAPETPREAFKPEAGKVDTYGRKSRHPAMLARAKRETLTA